MCSDEIGKRETNERRTRPVDDSESNYKIECATGQMTIKKLPRGNRAGL